MPFLASEGCFWPLTASMTSEVKKKPCQCLSLQKFEKLQCNAFFNRMHGLTVNRIVSLSGHPSIINKMTNLTEKLIEKKRKCKHFPSQNFNSQTKTSTTSSAIVCMHQTRMQTIRLINCKHKGWFLFIIYLCKCFTCFTKTFANLTTYSRKPRGL